VFEKIKNPLEALRLSDLKDGSLLQISGFLADGTSEILIDAILETGVKNLQLICNDTSFQIKG